MRHFDLFLNFIFESFKHKIAVVIFPYLIYNTVQMSQFDSFCAEKTYLSHMYDASVCDQHILSN